MKIKLILMTTVVLLFGWEFAQAQFTGGIGRGDSMGRWMGETDPGGPVPDRKVNFWVHSPGYEYDKIRWKHNDALIPLSEEDGYWGFDEEVLNSICETDSSKDELQIVQNNDRVGMLYVDFCNLTHLQSNFKAILLLNSALDIPYHSNSDWSYYVSTDEVMLSMLVAPDGFVSKQSPAPNMGSTR